MFVKGSTILSKLHTLRRYEINSDVLHTVAFEMNSVRLKGPSNTVNINSLQWSATGLTMT